MRLKINIIIGKVVNNVDRLKSSSTSRKANMVNLTGIMNQQKQTNFLNNQINKTVQTIGNMKASGSDEDNDKKKKKMTTMELLQQHVSGSIPLLRRHCAHIAWLVAYPRLPLPW